ncbi:hypothetical protein [Cohnella abietis]|uniref:N-acetyltransferase domain-containing protein n=1 Tax=Cohnella abietis TaxID=2507935 RepID=A0A3T1CY43_9BACL|nr:hypothetical protein [Cohnella abietis]BBI30721.1 hypothetical protein KCTCHS21_01200 [Cohnella abietis]
MYFIELDDSNRKIELSTSVKYTSCSHFLDFPEVNFDSDCTPIHHTVKLMASAGLLREELNCLDIESKLNGKYHYDKSSDEFIIAKLTISEFPSEWKELMEESWSMWLEALDGDHVSVGNRADEIEENELYDDPFLFGSLFYIKRVDVHPLFRGNRTGTSLIKYTFRYLIKDTDGMIFLIAKPMQSLLSAAEEKFSSSTKLANYYKSCGFKRVAKLDSKSILMEAKLNNFR